MRRFDPDNPVIFTDDSNTNFVYLKPGARVIVEMEWAGEIRFIGHCIIDTISSSPKRDQLRPWRNEYTVNLKHFQPFIPPRIKNFRIRQVLNSIPSYYWRDSIRLIPQEVYNTIILYCSTYRSDFSEEFELPPQYDAIDSIINREESDTLEFKATMCTPMGSEDEQIQKIDKQITTENDGTKILAYKRAIEARRKEIPALLKHEIGKTVAAFLNTNGGHLIVGILEERDGKRTVVGIERDFPNIGEKGTWDGWRLYFLDLLAKYGICQGVIANNIRLRRDGKDGKTIARITIAPGLKATWLTMKKDGKEVSHFYVRSSGKTEELDGPEAADYIKHRFT